MRILNRDFIKGFLIATVIFAALFIVFFKNGKLSGGKPYIILKSNYKIDGAGFLSKGTILRIDEGMSEGFTRYILYLNLKENDFENYDKNEKGIIPYWLVKE